MPNTTLALLDTATEPAIAVEGRDRCEWLVSAVPTVRQRSPERRVRLGFSNSIGV
jgi:hypothetical protein